MNLLEKFKLSKQLRYDLFIFLLHFLVLNKKPFNDISLFNKIIKFIY